MYYTQPTWIEYGPADGAVKGLCGPRRRRGLRGLGLSPCPSALQLQGIVDPTDPCQSGAPIPQPSPVPSTCFMPVFPFVGTTAYNSGICSPVFTIPDPWPVVITAGLGALLAYKFLLGGRR